MFNKQAKLKNIQIKVNTPEELLINGDKNLLQIVLVNLVNNAVKFTKRNGLIELSVRNEENKLKFVVKDNGVGISPDRLSKLFKEEDVESTLGTGNEKGTGFGLLLCKEFVEMHNGQISVKSVDGKGSEFWFTLPLK